MMAAAAVAIFIFREDIQGMFEDSTTTKKDKEAQEEVIADGGSSGGSSGTTKTPDSGKTGSGKTGTGKTPKTPSGKSTMDENDPIAKRYPMPTMTLEDAVDNWNNIPEKAFGRYVTIKAPVKMAIPNIPGDSTAKPGAKLMALGAKGGKLIVAASKTARAQGMVDIDDTDFKEVLGKIFDDWKATKVAAVKKQRLRASKLLPSTPTIVATSTGSATSAKQDVTGLERYVAELGEIPKRNADGKIQLMIDSIKRGDVTEIKLSEISHWGPVAREKIDDEYYWTAAVEYETVSMFGTIPTEALALIKNGKVINWIYTGSEEDVP